MGYFAGHTVVMVAHSFVEVVVVGMKLLCHIGEVSLTLDLHLDELLIVGGCGMYFVRAFDIGEVHHIRFVVDL